MIFQLSQHVTVVTNTPGRDAWTLTRTGSVGLAYKHDSGHNTNFSSEINSQKKFFPTILGLQILKYFLEKRYQVTLLQFLQHTAKSFCWVLNKPIRNLTPQIDERCHKRKLISSSFLEGTDGPEGRQYCNNLQVIICSSSVFLRDSMTSTSSHPNIQLKAFTDCPLGRGLNVHIQTCPPSHASKHAAVLSGVIKFTYLQIIRYFSPKTPTVLMNSSFLKSFFFFPQHATEILGCHCSRSR